MSSLSSDTIEQLDNQSLETGFFQAFSSWVPASLRRVSNIMDEGGGGTVEEETRKAEGDRPDPPNTSTRGKAKPLFEANSADADDAFLKAYPSVKLDFKEKDRLTSGSNYDVWALRMRGFLREARLWPWAEGTCIRLELTNTERILLQDGEASESQQKWDMLDERAQRIIRMGLSEAMVMSTSSAITA